MWFTPNKAAIKRSRASPMFKCLLKEFIKERGVVEIKSVEKPIVEIQNIVASVRKKWWRER